MLIQRIRKIGLFFLRIPPQRQKFLLLFGVVFVFGISFFPHFVRADVVTDAVVTATGYLASVIFSLLGKLLTAVIDMLIKVAQYNKIIDQGTVISTWVLIKDFVNMFFVFGLLLIAFSTILHFQDYEAKRRLPRFVFYAVLVNFSLTICGLFIDIAQVIMLTFVNAFKDSALTNFTSMTGLLDYGTLQLNSGTVNAAEVLGGYIVAIAFMVLALAAIGAMLVILVARVLMLWILVILSPFAFVLPAIPRAERYAAQWWEMFSKYVITGPLLAFFIWLALTVVGTDANIGNAIIGNEGVEFTKTKVGNSGFFINFLIGIGMLFAGLMLTSRLGGAMGTIVGKAQGVAAGRIGPTPMRWARERWESYRGARQSVRREQAQRFGQGASALQDRAITGRLQQLTGLPLNYATRLAKRGVKEGAELTQKGALKAAASGPSGGWRDRWAGKVFNAAGGVSSAADQMRWKPGELTRARAKERANTYEDKKQAADQATYQKAGRLSMKDDTELHARLNKPNISAREEAAIVDTLNTKFALKQSDLGAINRTRAFLGDTETRQKFDDLLKRTDIEIAFLSKIYRKTNAETGKEEINIDKFRSDLNQGKINSSAVTNPMFNIMDTQLGKHGAFMERWIEDMGDPKEIRSSIGALSRNVIDEQMKYVTLHHLTEEKALAVGEGSNHWKNVFNRKNDAGEVKFDEEMAGRFFANAQNKEMFVKGHGSKFENQDLFEFLHDNWLKYEFTGSQWAKMYEDTEARESVRKITPDLLKKIHGKKESYDTQSAYGYGKGRALDSIISFHKSDKYTDENGKLKDIFEINDRDAAGNLTPIAEAALESFHEQVRQNRLSAAKLENMYVYETGEDGKEIIDKNGKPKVNERLLSILPDYDSGELAKLFKESRKRGEVVLKYMAQNYGKYQSQVDRLANNNALVHMVTPELRALIAEEKKKFDESGGGGKKDDKKAARKNEEEAKPKIETVGKYYKVKPEDKGK